MLRNTPPSTHERGSGKEVSVKGRSPLRLLQISDFHLRQKYGDTLLGVDTEHSFKETLAAALADHPSPDLALLTGDLAQDASPETYQRLCNSLAPLPCPAYCLPGNHDDSALMATYLAGSSVFCESRIELGSWQIICLDSCIPGSPNGRLAVEQWGLLEQWLATRPDQHTLIALHHPPIPTGSAWLDTMQLQNSAQFLATLRNHQQVKGVIFGHIHQELDVEEAGLRLLGCPSTCFQFKPGQAEFTIDLVPPGYRWLELYPDGLIATSVGRLNNIPAGLSPQAEGY